MTTTLSAADFAAKWRDNAGRERASSQEHFIDLCRMLSVPTPNDPPASADYTFEASAERLGTGSQGWADVWKRRCFGWEYKGAHTENVGVSFMGSSKKTSFDIPGDMAREMLGQPTNVNGRLNADVVAADVSPDLGDRTR
ncbi:MAG: hypothetical protein OXE43_01360 [Chloroflexi bacterium]|nr:hypothetical protein [Chloroflexota bacterium]